MLDKTIAELFKIKSELVIDLYQYADDLCVNANDESGDDLAKKLTETLQDKINPAQYNWYTLKKIQQKLDRFSKFAANEKNMSELNILPDRSIYIREYSINNTNQDNDISVITKEGLYQIKDSELKLIATRRKLKEIAKEFSCYDIINANLEKAKKQTEHLDLYIDISTEDSKNKINNTSKFIHKLNQEIKRKHGFFYYTTNRQNYNLLATISACNQIILDQIEKTQNNPLKHSETKIRDDENEKSLLTLKKLSEYQKIISEQYMKYFLNTSTKDKELIKQKREIALHLETILTSTNSNNANQELYNYLQENNKTLNKKNEDILKTDEFGRDLIRFFYNLFTAIPRALGFTSYSLWRSKWSEILHKDDSNSEDNTPHDPTFK